MSEDYKVQLDNYSGPLDLLLYLIRREEVAIHDIPISRITAQYVQYVEFLKEVDPDHIGEFLVLAATLMEIKSRLLLPVTPDDEEDEELFDPRLELVRQLLEYKQFKDLAGRLAEAADERSQRFGRLPMLAPTTEVDLDYVQVWDLVGAFGKLLTQVGLAGARHEVLYDDTPLALHAADMIDRLQREQGSMRFEKIFEGRLKSEIIGLFLALLELIRAKRVRAEQEGLRDSIVIHLLDDSPLLNAELDHEGGPQDMAEPVSGD